MTDLATEIAVEKTPEPARLRIYIGAAPGVGKTFHMLNDANLLREQGVDVVIGLVESHGRKETEAQIREAIARPSPQALRAEQMKSQSPPNPNHP